jgi:hypothetical protein
LQCGDILDGKRQDSLVCGSKCRKRFYRSHHNPANPRRGDCPGHVPSECEHGRCRGHAIPYLVTPSNGQSGRVISVGQCERLG